MADRRNRTLLAAALGAFALLLMLAPRVFAADDDTFDDDAPDDSIAFLGVAVDSGNVVLTLAAGADDVVFRIARLKGGTVWTVTDSTTPAAFDTDDSDGGLVFDVVDPCPQPGQLTYLLRRRTGDVWEDVDEQSIYLDEASACASSTDGDQGGGCSTASRTGGPGFPLAVAALAAALLLRERRRRP